LSERAARPTASDGFAVSPGERLFGRVCHEYPGLWARLERFETSLIREELEAVTLESPIYVTGLARSGTTILLELLAKLPSVTSHRYRDFPPIWTPYLWNRFLELVPTRDTRPHERPHGDGIEITPDSPEAMEEAIWMRFFPDSHDPSLSNRLDASTRNDAFADFYRRHLRKLLLVRGGRRYLAKGNYNIARLGYLQALFPNARFVIPIRHPVSHIASLMRQHQVFSDAQRTHPESRDYLRRVGHFEFGLDRVPINMGAAPDTREILDRWAAGNEIAGWAAYWFHVYGSVLDQVEQDAGLRESALIVRYEDLNARPADELQRILDHCRLEADAPQVATMAARLRQPSYYKSEFGDRDEQAIMRIAGPAMARYGYATTRN